MKCKAGFEHCGVVVCRQTMEGPLSRAKEERAFLAYLTHLTIDRFTERKLCRAKVISRIGEGADGKAACRSNFGTRDWPGREEVDVCTRQMPSTHRPAVNSCKVSIFSWDGQALACFHIRTCRKRCEVEIPDAMIIGCSKMAGNGIGRNHQPITARTSIAGL